MRSAWVPGSWGLVLYGCVVAGVLGLEPGTALAKATGTAQSYLPNSLNYPPIGAGIETMARLPGGGYAIVLGNNCTAEILNCTTYTFQYGTNPVQLVILDRTTLTPLFVKTFTGSVAEAAMATAAIGTWSATNEIVVVLAALLTGNTTQIDPSWFGVIGALVPEPQVSLFNDSLIVNLGGWSAIGVPQTSGTPGPVGHLNPGRGDWYGVQHPIGDLTGYLQIQPGSQSWIFTTGGFVAFNTSFSQTAPSNTMRINNTDYPSAPLTTSSGAPCAGGPTPGSGPGGFQVVVLNASTLSPLPPSFNTPVNQTFATNCGEADTDIAGINGLAAALANVLSGPSAGASEGGALVFLQSIGNPIVATQFSAQQELGPPSTKILTLQFPGETTCNCALTDWQNVQQPLATEMTWVNYIQNGLTTGGASLMDVLTDSSNPAFIDLQSAANTVLGAVDMANSGAAVAGFWVTLASNALKFAKNLASSDGLGPVLGIWSTIGPLGENLASLDSSTTLGQIQTTAKELPSELSSRFMAAACRPLAIARSSRVTRSPTPPYRRR